MTATEQSFDVPYDPPPRQPKPAACQEPTVAGFTVSHPVRDNGFVDTEITITRSCGHWYFSTHEPVVGSRAMACLGPQPETRVSGRADKTLPPMKKGKRWTRLPVKVA